MWLKAQNEMAGLWPHAAMGPVERMVRQHSMLKGQELHASLLSRFCGLLRLEVRQSVFRLLGSGARVLLSLAPRRQRSRRLRVRKLFPKLHNHDSKIRIGIASDSASRDLAGCSVRTHVRLEVPRERGYWRSQQVSRSTSLRAQLEAFLHPDQRSVLVIPLVPRPGCWLETRVVFARVLCLLVSGDQTLRVSVEFVLPNV